MLRPVVMPGLPVDYTYVSGMLDKSAQVAHVVPAVSSYVSFQHGLYPDVSAVKDYLDNLWDPTSDSLAMYGQSPRFTLSQRLSDAALGIALTSWLLFV